MKMVFVTDLKKSIAALQEARENGPIIASSRNNQIEGYDTPHDSWR